ARRLGENAAELIAGGGRGRSAWLRQRRRRPGALALRGLGAWLGKEEEGKAERARRQRKDGRARGGRAQRLHGAIPGQGSTPKAGSGGPPRGPPVLPSPCACPRGPPRGTAPPGRARAPCAAQRRSSGARLEPQRLGDPRPASALDRGQERGIGTL